MENINHPYLSLSRRDQKAALEALLFSSEEVLTLNNLKKLLISDDSVFESQDAPEPENNNGNGEVQISLSDESLSRINFSISYFEEMIDEINLELAECNRPYHIAKVAGGYQFATKPEYGELVQRLIKSKSRRRLSQAALESLAIIAYRQPITKPEIEQIRGVNSNEVVNSLIDKGFVKIVGRKDALGKPLLFGTTDDFLKIFGLNSLSEMPKLREIEEISDETIMPKSHIEAVIDATKDTPSSRFRELQEKIEEGIKVDYTEEAE